MSTITINMATLGGGDGGGSGVSPAIGEDVTDIVIHNFKGEPLDWLPANFKRLEILGSGPLHADHLAHVEQLESLKILGVNFAPDGALCTIPPLRVLHLVETNVSHIGRLREIKSLEILRVDGGDLRDVEPLNGAPNLRVISFREMERLNDISVLATCSNLEDIDVSETAVRDMSSFSILSKLERVHLESTQVDEIGWLRTLKHIKSLNVNDTKIRDYTPIKSLKKLSSLKADGRALEDRKSIKAFLSEKHPGLMARSFSSAKDTANKIPKATKDGIEWIENHQVTVGLISAPVVGVFGWVTGLFEALFKVVL